jgi:hypothetical protein
VTRTREAQSELKDQIESLSADLKRIAEEQTCPVDLGNWVKLDIRATATGTWILTVLNLFQRATSPSWTTVRRELWLFRDAVISLSTNSSVYFQLTIQLCAITVNYLLTLSVYDILTSITGSRGSGSGYSRALFKRCHTRITVCADNAKVNNFVSYF